MIAFKVRLNYHPLTVAGADEMSVLTASITGCFSASGPRGSDFHLHVGGLSRDRGDGEGEHVRWTGDRQLGVGDFVSIEIVETDEASPVLERDRRETSPSIVDGEDVIILLQQEFLLLLEATHDDGLDPNTEDGNLAFRTSKLFQLGLLKPDGDRLIASELGHRFLNNNQPRREFVHRFCVSKG